MSSSGEVVLLGALMAVAGGTPGGAGTVVLALVAVALRWGETSLDAISGAQSVLGAGGVVGPALAAASSWCAAAALVLGNPGAWATPAFGLVAGLAVAGPGAQDPGHLALRVAAALVAVVLASAVARGTTRRPARRRPLQALALILAAAAVVLVLAA